MRPARFRKQVAILLATLLGFVVSGVLLARAVGFASPWVQAMLMFYFLALGKVAEPLFSFRLPAPLRRLRPWELGGVVHRRLGVTRYGRLLRDTPLRHLNRSVYLAACARDRVELRRLVAAAEASHFWAALLLLPGLGACLLRRQWLAAAVLLVLQATVNVYPILHLRLVRGRLERVTDRTVAGRTHASNDRAWLKENRSAGVDEAAPGRRRGLALLALREDRKGELRCTGTSSPQPRS